MRTTRRNALAARGCTDERERAREFQSPVVDERAGMPFRVDLLRNFPEFVTEADLVRLVEPVALLDQKIERQLGYRIVEAGSVLPVPDGMPPDWNTDGLMFIHTCPLPREPRHVQGFQMDDTNPCTPGSEGQAQVRCGSFRYTQVPMTDWPCLECPGEPLTPRGGYLDALTVHEVRHVVGFAHVDDSENLDGGRGVPMSAVLTWAGRPDVEAVLWEDIDTLRCIFPEGG